MAVVPRLLRRNVAFLCCDLQSAFQTAVPEFDRAAFVAIRMLRFAALNITARPIRYIITEQYPKGLGHTVDSILTEAARLGSQPTTATEGRVVTAPPHAFQAEVFAKTQFSMATPELLESLHRTSVDAVVIFGIEAHVCVQQTVLDLVQANTKVWIAADGTHSQVAEDRDYALKRFGSMYPDVVVSTSEAILFDLVGDAKHPGFKVFSQLMKERYVRKTTPDRSGTAE